MRRPNRKRSRSARRARAPGIRTAGARVSSSGVKPYVASFQRLIGEIFRFNGQLLDVAAGLSADLGITPTHWQTVAVIRDEPMTVAEIARRVGLRRQSVQHTVRQLQARRLVELVPNPKHQRARLVRLTPSGKRLMGRLLQRQAVLTRHFTGGLGYTSADLQALVLSLARMREAAVRATAGEQPPGPVAPR